MAVLKTFASIAHPDRRIFRFSSEAYSRYCEVANEFVFAATFGDGQTAHTPDQPIPMADLADYLYSAAAFIGTEIQEDADNPVPTVWWEMHHLVHSGPSTETLDFFASVRWTEKDETRTRWYAPSLQKIGTSEKLAHDRRYARVESWMDGSPAALYRMCGLEHASNLGHLITAFTIREWAQRRSIWCDGPIELAGWKWHSDVADPHEASRSICVALDLIRTVTEGRSKLYRANVGIANYRSNLRRAADQPAA